MIPAAELNPFGDVVFTHIDVNGEQRTFAVSRLQTFAYDLLCKRPSMRSLVAINEANYRIVITRCGIEPHRVKQMRLAEETVGGRVACVAVCQPIIICNFDNGEQLLVDGNHRYVSAYQNGAHYIPAILLKEKQWKPYLVEGLEGATAEKLTTMFSGIR